MAVSIHHPFCRQHPEDTPAITAHMLLHSFDSDSFLFTTKGSTAQRPVEAMFQSIHFYTLIFGYFDNINTVLNLVSIKNGISFVPSTCMLPNAGIRIFPLAQGIYRQHIIAYRKDLPMPPIVSDLLDIMHRIYASCTSGGQEADTTRLS